MKGAGEGLKATTSASVGFSFVTQFTIIILPHMHSSIARLAPQHFARLMVKNCRVLVPGTMTLHVTFTCSHALDSCRNVQNEDSFSLGLSPQQENKMSLTNSSQNSDQSFLKLHFLFLCTKKSENENLLVPLLGPSP